MFKCCDVNETGVRATRCLTISAFLRLQHLGDSLSWHNGSKFSTKDADNDAWKDGSCAQGYRGAWWYYGCHFSSLNGVYRGSPHNLIAYGVHWAGFRGYSYSLKKTEMKISALN